MMSYEGAEKEAPVTGMRALQREIHAIATEKGWWGLPSPGRLPGHSEEKERTFGELIALCHSELSEALESYRNGEMAHHSHGHASGSAAATEKPEGWGIELADTIIRILDMAERYGLDMEALIRTKMAFNRTRPFRHGGKRI